MSFKEKALPTVSYSAIQALLWASYSAVLPFASMYLVSHGFTNSQVGYVIAAAGIIATVLQPVVGGLADRKQKLHSIIAAILGVMILLAAGLRFGEKSFFATAVLYALVIAFLQTITPLIHSVGMFFINRGIRIDFGISRAVGSLAFAAASALLGILVDRGSVSVILYADAVLFAALMIGVLLFRYPVRESARSENASANRGLFPFLKTHKRLLMLLAGNVLVFTCYGAMDNYIYQVVAYHGGGSVETGFAVSLCAALELPALFGLSRLNRRFSSGVLLRVSVIFICMKAFLLLLAQNMTMVYLAMTAQLIGYGLNAGTAVCYINHTVEEENAVFGQSVLCMTCTMGSVLGSISGGLMLDQASVPGMLLFITVTGAVGAVIVGLTAEKGKKAQ